MKDKVEAVINTIRPMLQADGGDLRLISVDEKTGEVKVALQGACMGCPHANQTIKMGVEARLKQAVPEVTRVVAENL